MNKIYFRIAVILGLLGAIYYVTTYKYKGVPRSFFVEGAQLSHQSQFLILTSSGDTVATEYFEIHKGIHNIYFESKKFDHQSNKISEAFRLVTDTSGIFIWGSYENFDLVSQDSTARKFALYSMFHEDDYIRSMPVVNYREKEKSEIELNGDHFLVYNGLTTVMNTITFHHRKTITDYRMIVIDTVGMTYNDMEVVSTFSFADSSDVYNWVITAAETKDTVQVIEGKLSQTTFNTVYDKKSGLYIKKVNGSDYKFKEIDAEAMTRGFR